MTLDTGSFRDKCGELVLLIRRVPVEVLMGVAWAATSSAAIANYDWEWFFEPFFLMWGPVFALVFATSFLYEFGVLDRVRRWGITIGVIGAGVAYGSFVLEIELIGEVWRWGYVTGAVLIGTMAVPWLVDRRGGLRRETFVWYATVEVALRVVTAVFYASVLALGIGIAFVAVNELFPVTVEPEILGHALAWICGVGGIGALGTELPQLADCSPTVSDLKATITYRVGSLLALPLLGLYLLILYAYGGMVLLYGDAPSNFLSPLALGAALFGLVTLFLVEPLREDEEQYQWLIRVLNWFPVAYLLVLPMPAWAIWVRIQQHGWTETRYLGILAVVGLALCLGWAGWRIVRGRSYSATSFPAVFAVLLLVGAVGPLSAPRVATRSQIARLQEEVAAVRAQSSPTGQQESVDDARNRIWYLHEHFGPTVFRQVADSIQVDASMSAGDVEDRLLGGAVLTSNEIEKRYEWFEYDRSIPVPEAGRVYDLSGRSYNSRYELVTSGSSLIVVSDEGRRDTFTVEPQRVTELQRWRDSTGSDADPPASLMTFAPDDAARGANRRQLILRELEVFSLPDKREWTVEGAEGVLFVPADAE